VDDADVQVLDEDLLDAKPPQLVLEGVANRAGRRIAGW
jgi:hypothetical protein